MATGTTLPHVDLRILHEDEMRGAALHTSRMCGSYNIVRVVLVTATYLPWNWQGAILTSIKLDFLNPEVTDSHCSIHRFHMKIPAIYNPSSYKEAPSSHISSRVHHDEVFDSPYRDLARNSTSSG
jgi:hypothetical protein